MSVHPTVLGSYRELASFVAEARSKRSETVAGDAVTVLVAIPDDGLRRKVKSKFDKCFNSTGVSILEKFGALVPSDGAERATFLFGWFPKEDSTAWLNALEEMLARVRECEDPVRPSIWFSVAGDDSRAAGLLLFAQDDQVVIDYDIWEQLGADCRTRAIACGMHPPDFQVWEDEANSRAVSRCKELSDLGLFDLNVSLSEFDAAKPRVSRGMKSHKRLVVPEHQTDSLKRSAK